MSLVELPREYNFIVSIYEYGCKCRNVSIRVKTMLECSDDCDIRIVKMVFFRPVYCSSRSTLYEPVCTMFLYVYGSRIVAVGNSCDDVAKYIVNKYHGYTILFVDEYGNVRDVFRRIGKVDHM